MEKRQEPAPRRRGAAIAMGRLCPRHAITVAALMMAGEPAWAQDQRPTGYPRSANERGDQSVGLSAVYTAEVRGVATGGIARGARHLDNLDLQLALDADRLIGWHGARLFFYGVYDNGRALSRALVGDVQGVSNIETRVRAARLFEAWAEQDIGHHGSVRVGLYNLNAEFDTTESGGLFLLSSHGIGPDFAQSGRNGPSIFPVTSLAVRGEMAVDDHVLVRVAVLDGVPGDPAHPARTAIRLSRRDGALVATEVDYLKGGTKAAIGAWGYTARFAAIDMDGDRGRRGNKGIYAYAEHRLTGDRADDPRGLAGWVRIGMADTRFNPIGHYLGGGVVYTGALPGRGDDQAGLSVAMAGFGDRYRRSRTMAGEPTGRREVVVEAAYQAVLTPWLSIQPDVQYVVGPGGDRRIGDAIVLGLRVKVGQ